MNETDRGSCHYLPVPRVGSARGHLHTHTSNRRHHGTLPVCFSLWIPTDGRSAETGLAGLSSVLLQWMIALSLYVL